MCCDREAKWKKSDAMYRLFIWLLTVFWLFTTQAHAIKCTLKGPLKLKSEVFYVGPYECGKTSCLTKLKPNSKISVPHSRKFKLIYVPKANEEAYESAAIIQVDMEGNGNLNPNKLDVSRSRIDFSCNVRGHRGALEKEGVSFELFETWHATGKPRRTNLAIWLRKKFHFKFDVSGSCVATGRKGVRERFKFGNRDEMASAVDRLTASLSTKPNFTRDAYGSEKAARKLHVEGYAARPSADKSKTCIQYAFSTPSKGKKMVISMDDLFQFEPTAKFLFSSTLRNFTIQGE